jgi:hypothetical protein
MSTTRTASPPTRGAGRAGPVAALLLGLATLALPACRKPPPVGEAPDDGPKAAPREEDKQAVEARKRQSAANLKQIARNLFDYAVERRHLLPAALCDKKTGRPLLSWRVVLLPHIGQEALYKQFNLDEPWDGPNNKKLLDKMPKVYAPPGGDAGRGMTNYRGLIAAPGSAVRTAWATLSDKEAPLGVWGGRFPAPLEDGTSNTFAVVEAAEAVPWTRPGELDYDPKKPLPKLGGLFPDGFHAGMMDGAVLFISSQVKEADVRGLITANGREPVDVGALMDKDLIRHPER